MSPTNTDKREHLRLAKVRYAQSRNRLHQALDACAPAEEVSRLRTELDDAGSCLEQAEINYGAPPRKILVDKHPMDDKSRRLRTELAYAKAEMKRQKRLNTNKTMQAEAEQKFLTALQRLEAHLKSQ